MSALHGLYRRWQVLVHELAKFGIVGAVNTALDFGLANLLHLGAGMDQYLAKALSVSVAATSSYFMNRHWTFRHRARTGLGREYALFFVLNGVGLAIAEACIWVVRVPMHKEGPLWFNLAQIAGLAIGMLFRFATYKRWVFVRPEVAAAEALAEGSVADPGTGAASAQAATVPVSSNGDRPGNAAQTQHGNGQGQPSGQPTPSRPRASS
jgi:putative flippase GtrA